MAESRARRQIRQAVEAKGGVVSSLKWERPRWEPNIGPIGGWSVEAEHPVQPNPAVLMHAFGHNLAAILEEIEAWPAASTQPSSPPPEVEDCETCGGSERIPVSPVQIGHIVDRREGLTKPCPDCTGKQPQPEPQELEGIHNWPSPAEPQGDAVEALAAEMALDKAVPVNDVIRGEARGYLAIVTPLLHRDLRERLEGFLDSPAFLDHLRAGGQRRRKVLDAFFAALDKEVSDA